MGCSFEGDPDRHEDGGDPVKLFHSERPSVLPAALAQVVAVSGRSAVPTAHGDLVGQPAARAVSVNGSPRLKVRTQPIASQAVGGFAGNDIDVRKYAMDGASGVPPRGRPV